MTMKGFFNNTLEKLGIKSKEDVKMGVAFVTSGTNAVGYRVACGLLDAGYEHVRVGVWKGARQPPGTDEGIGQRVALELEQRGATVIKFDWTSQPFYQMALAGVKSVFCTIPHMEADVETFAAFVEACKTYGVEHFVKTSFYSVIDRGITYEGTLPYAKFQQTSDKELMKPPAHKKIPIGGGGGENHMTYTVLRACHLMSTPMIYQGPVMREKGRYIVASYGMGVNYISPNDVAKAAIVALVDRKNHKNKVYTLTGAAPVNDKDLVKLLSDFFKKDLEYVTLGYHEFQDQLGGRNLDDWLIQDLTIAEQIKATGVEEKDAAYSKDLETILGMPATPEGFKDYLKQKESMTYQEFPGKPTPVIKKKPEPAPAPAPAAAQAAAPPAAEGKKKEGTPPPVAAAEGKKTEKVKAGKTEV